MGEVKGVRTYLAFPEAINLALISQNVCTPRNLATHSLRNIGGDIYGVVSV